MAWKQPAFQFYPGDWLKDPELSMCTPATRGIWMDLLCAMHERGRVGELSGTVEQLAQLSRCSPAALESALTDLRTNRAADVTVRNDQVTVSNRRMQREHKSRKSSAKRQKRRRERSRDGPVTQKSRPPSSSSTSVSSANAEPPPTPPAGGAGRRTPGFDPKSAQIPVGLDTQNFRKVWEEFCDFRSRDKRKPITERSCKMLLKKLDEAGLELAVAALEQSIANGWQGVFPENVSQGEIRGKGKPKRYDATYDPDSPTVDRL